MPTVLILPEALRDAPGRHIDLLQDAGFEVRYPKNPHLVRGARPAEELIDELSVADATIASSERYSPEVIAALPKLRVIARSGVGYDAVDVAAATAGKIAVTITPTANHDAVAELALGLLFGVTKFTTTADAAVRRGEWPRRPLVPLRGRTLGILGLGRIGKSLARRARALDMHVLATETFPDEQFVNEHGIELVDFDALLGRSDFVSVHCPLNDATRHLFNRETFERMKSGSVLINTARGGLVDESALLVALESGKLAAAGLDVFEKEPPSVDNPLFQLENVVLSPHMGGLDATSVMAMGEEAADCIVKLSRNEWPGEAVVNQELRDRWSWTQTAR